MKMARAFSALFIAASFTNAHAQLFKPSKKEQVKAGLEYAAKLRKEKKILADNDPRVILLRKIGEDLLNTRTEKEKQSEPWQFSFDVIESKEVNAFALPGGPVFFYTGLIDKLTTIDEIAGVMGHELIHCRREHWASAYNSQMEKEAGILVLGSIFGVSKSTMNAAGALNQFFGTLPNSRKQETESDRYGFDMVVAAKYNPQGMINVFEMFRKLKGNNAPPEFLSTHPDDVNRIKNLSKMRQDAIQKGKISAGMKLTPLPFQTPAMQKPVGGK